ncbi:MAG TPA: substrate-binding domain-containing protein [Vicinamibacterales bacterium]|nr:substrate-binding domain-containing protein [Vicinamibacterales bacterium]
MPRKTTLSQLRRDQGWTQEDLADRSAVSRAEVSAIETGRLMPSVAVALRLAAALGQSVEQIFGPPSLTRTVPWAWEHAVTGDGRTWKADVDGRTIAFPVELTAAGVLPHDAWFDGQQLHARSGSAPESTLVIAGCDPLVGLLVRELAHHHRIRVLPLLRSSAQAIELLRQGLVHVAGLHVTDADGRSTNADVVRARIGPGHRLLHQVRWESGIAVGSDRRERSVAALLRAKVRWVNREEGSAARQTFDTLLASHRRPAGYDHVVGDLRAVATTVSSGWAEAGVCVRPAAAAAHVSFIPVHQEAYELCVRDAVMDDRRVSALLTTLRSTTYRQFLADVPGCSSAHTGDVRAVA